MMLMDIVKRVPQMGEYDVVVAGGGVSGVAAAVSAARAGMRVLLLEKSTQLGGLATIGLINLFVPMCNGRGTQIIRGMADEMMRLAIRNGYDTLPDCWKNGGEWDGKSRLLTRFSAGLFSLELNALLKREGVDVLYDIWASSPYMEGKHAAGVITESKSGTAFYRARMVVDTTGDGDLLARAGVPMVNRGNYDIYTAFMVSLDNCRRAVENGRIADAVTSICGGNASLYGTNQPEGKLLWTGTSVEDISAYLSENQIKMLDQFLRTDDRQRDIVALPGMPQMRTTRRIDGEYVLRVEDVYRHFDDSVATICDFDKRDHLYEVPYRCLVHPDFDNMITAGRSAAGEGYAWDVLRVIPPAILTGQAAGAAAAQAIRTQKPIAFIDVHALQDTLARADSPAHFDDRLIPAARQESVAEHVEENEYT